MKLLLNQQSTALGTLRLWQLELRNKLFSSPTEFVYVDYDPTPVSITGAGYSINSSFSFFSKYMQHGKLVHFDMYCEVDITSGGGGCSLTFRLPVACQGIIDVGERWVVGVIREGVTTYESLLGRLDRDADGGFISCRKANGAAIGTGAAQFTFSACYQAA